MENENDAILARVPSAPPRFLAIRQVLQQTAPHQYVKFIHKSLLFNYAVLL